MGCGHHNLHRLPGQLHRQDPHRLPLRNRRRWQTKTRTSDVPGDRRGVSFHLWRLHGPRRQLLRSVLPLRAVSHNDRHGDEARVSRNFVQRERLDAHHRPPHPPRHFHPQNDAARVVRDAHRVDRHRHLHRRRSLQFHQVFLVDHHYPSVQHPHGAHRDRRRHGELLVSGVPAEDGDGDGAPGGVQQHHELQLQRGDLLEVLLRYHRLHDLHGRDGPDRRAQPAARAVPRRALRRRRRPGAVLLHRARVHHLRYRREPPQDPVARLQLHQQPPRRRLRLPPPPPPHALHARPRGVRAALQLAHGLRRLQHRHGPRPDLPVHVPLETPLASAALIRRRSGALRHRVRRHRGHPRHYILFVGSLYCL